MKSWPRPNPNVNCQPLSYCLARPQYLCLPLSQQPVLTQYDLRAPQAVRQVESTVVAAFVQLVMQTFSSPLHFIGSARTGCGSKRPKPKRAAAAANILTVQDAMRLQTYSESRSRPTARFAVNPDNF